MRILNIVLGLASTIVFGLVPVIPSTWDSPDPGPLRPQGDTDSSAHIVINEVAWGGTAASSADEWIELASTSNVTQSLDGWRIVALDGSPEIPLAGDLGPYRFYLIERTDDTTISNVPADLVTSFGTGLGNEGETLLLLTADGKVADTVNASGGAWPTLDGGSPDYRSMERRSPTAPDDDDQWISHDGTTGSALDALGNLISGSPSAINRAFLPVWGEVCDVAVQTRGPAALMLGEMATYHLSVANYGGLIAKDVQLIDDLPPALQFIAQQSDLPFVEADGTLSWEVGELAPDISKAITVTVALTPTLPLSQTITNTLTVTTTSPDLCPWNDGASWATVVSTSGSVGTSIVISGVNFDGYQYGDEDEAIEVTNVGQEEARLEGWTLCDATDGQLSCWPLPDLMVPARSSAWLAKDAVAFAASFGVQPAAQLENWPRLANAGDEVILRDPAGTLIDVLVYGDGSLSAPHWIGPALMPYTSDGLRSVAGQILTRALDETTGMPVSDTNTAGDWLQYPDDGLTRRRVRYPGWDLTDLYQPLKITEPTTLTLGIAPDNAYGLVAELFRQAQDKILIETYTFRHPDLLDILVAKAYQGLTVTLLLEGDPVGLGDLTFEWLEELAACEQLEAAGGACYFMIHEPADYVFNRYGFLHLKMIVVDDNKMALGSQNLTPTSLPADPKANGTFGSRGAVVLVENQHIAARARDIFQHDLDTAHRDILRWNTDYSDRYGPPPAGTVLGPTRDEISYTVRFPSPQIVTGILDLELLTGPEATLRRTDALAGMISRLGSHDRLYVQQQYERLAWGSDPVNGQNPRLVDYIDAARRGARVRVLLNGRNYVDGVTGPDAENSQTAGYLNALAKAEDLNLWASVGDPTGAGIHNKMVLVDSGPGSRYLHLGSVNGSEASNKINREIAIQVRSEEAFAYYLRLFESDWYRANPIYMPVIARNYTPPPPPADHPLVAEVCYTCAPTAEWIEIHNPGSTTMDLTGYKLTDAETAGAYESAFRFPDGTMLPAGTVLVVAINGAQVHESTLEFYESDPTIPNMVPYSGWGDLDYPLALRNEGDQVLLLGPEDAVVDGLVWGDASLPGTAPCAGVTTIGASLERFPASQDTDNCPADFRERYPPTPGQVP